jgi:outer membrane immunogenic protein
MLRTLQHETKRRKPEMTTINRLLQGAVGLVALNLAAPALAADLPARTYTKAPPIVAPVYDWSGFYIGLNGGGGSSRNCYTITDVAGAAVTPNSEGCHSATGGLAGGQIGYRWQSSAWVFGLEAQGDWADLKGSNSSLTATVPYINQTKIDAIGLFTGQVGYAWNNVLWYVKGGSSSIRPATPVGVARSEPASKSASRRTGPLPLSTTICSWAIPA